MLLVGVLMLEVFELDGCKYEVIKEKTKWDGAAEYPGERGGN